MMSWEHLVILPVVLPLFAGALLIAVERGARPLARPLALTATLFGLVIALALLARASSGDVQTYLLGNWQAPFGIVVVLDRLSALLVTLTAVVALASLLWATSGDDRRGEHFHALFQFQLMGLNGAFLTGDLFNLFVFFEVLLISSYGLLLHGGGSARLRAALHYVAFNLGGSALFLIAVALLYSVTGTLNMADLAVKVASLQGTQASIAKVAGALLLVVFAVKAALLPLYFWLPDTYGSASTPVAALFAIMTKVGVYAITRVTTLIFGVEAGLLAELARPFLPWIAMLTLLLGSLGALAASRLRVMVAYAIISSAGTLLIAFGLGSRDLIAAASFYLVNTTLVTSALFMLAELVKRSRVTAEDRCTAQADFSGRMGLAALFFVLAIAAAGLPPLAGFLGKALVLKAAWSDPIGAWVWGFVLFTSLLTMVAFARMGITIFWESHEAEGAKRAEKQPPASAATVAMGEKAGLTILLGSALAIVVWAGTLSSYTTATATQLLARKPYIESSLGKQPAPPAWDIRKEMRERGGK
jgi:multicomponent K+:H+ antiporter subunit D